MVFAPLVPVNVSLYTEPVRFSKPAQRIRSGTACCLCRCRRKADGYAYSSGQVLVRERVDAPIHR